MPFTSIENLTGGAQADTFVMIPGANIPGTVDGGSSSGNTLDYSAYVNRVVFVDLTRGIATDIGFVTNIQNVIYPRLPPGITRCGLLAEMMTIIQKEKIYTRLWPKLQGLFDPEEYIKTPSVPERL